VTTGSAPRRAVCPGSFDPFHLGHLDIIGRASPLYDEIVVAVLVNKGKASLFSVEERIEMLTSVTAKYGNVRVDSFHGLLVHYCQAHDIPVVIRGIRAVSDFDYELKMAQMNHGLTGLETLFMPTNPEFSFLSSSLVKEIATWDGDVGRLVPPLVLERLAVRLAERR
jgi:pantetheine-phosphate adenylyltransferase